jgi:hypothetical protein
MDCADTMDSWRRNPRPGAFSCKAFCSIRSMRSYQRVQLQEASRSQGTISFILPYFIDLPLNQNYMMLISMRIRMQGFVVFDFEDKYPQARKELAQWLSEGKLKRKETIVKGGISKAEEALVGLFAGKNIGTSSDLPYSLSMWKLLLLTLKTTGKTMVEVAKLEDAKAKL